MEKEIYLAGGCFWGAQHFLKKIEGVTFTQTGFANGNTDAPTYKEVYTDTTGYCHFPQERIQNSFSMIKTDI